MAYRMTLLTHSAQQVRRKRMPMRWCRSQKPANSTASACVPEDVAGSGSSTDRGQCPTEDGRMIGPVDGPASRAPIVARRRL